MDNTICPTCHNARDTHDRYCPQQPGAFPVAAETLTEIEQRLDGGAAPVRAASHVNGYSGGGGMSTFGLTHTVDALRDGQQIYVGPLMNEGNAYADFDRVCGLLLGAYEGDDETTVRLIHEGDLVAEQTIVHGEVLSGFDNRNHL